MIEKIIEWSAKHRLIVLLITGAAVIWAIWAIRHTPLDALPDLTDTQVIIYGTWDRPPQLIEDQLTYPVISSLLGTPKVKDIRGFSDYGFSYVYIIFEDGTDIYWARSRVLEYLSKVTPTLPAGAKVELGPDATGVGWVYQYALVDESGSNSLADLRTFQDWHLKYALQSVKGVSEVASVGGFVKQYQVVADPNALLAYGVAISDVVTAVRKANQEAGARLLEFSGREYMVTIRGYITSKEDIEEAVLKTGKNGVPIRVKNIAKVVTAPEIRRGVAELDGRGETVGGIVVMRHGENALTVIENVKKKLSEIKLPPGTRIVTTYDRSELIHRSIGTLTHKLIEEMIVVAIVIVIFLLHIPSAAIPIFTLPIAVLLSFIPMHYLGLTSNIMSLGGIAIAIGAMVDASIVVVENSHKKLSVWEMNGRKGDWHAVMIDSIKEVGRPSFFSLIVIAVAFIPIFTLEGMEGRLFHPLAYTKNLAMLFGAVLAITLDPAVRLLFTRLDYFKIKWAWLSSIVNTALVGKIHREEDHPISKKLFRYYGPIVDRVLTHPKEVIIAAAAVFIVSMPVFFIIGREFMPPLNEGSILYMPTTLPGISVTEATRLLQLQDKVLASFPEVDRVFGKAGRANTATDPAPFSMMETTVLLKPQNEWREKRRWYSFLPEFMKGPFRIFWPDRMSWEELTAAMDKALTIPGQVNAWTLPIKGRIDMLTTGVRTPVGIKIFGDDLGTIERIGRDIESALTSVKGTRSVYAERTAGGYFVDFSIKRSEIARYGLSIEDVQMTLMAALGGENITQTVEGRERFPVNVRYPRELRDDIEKIRRIYIPTPSGAQIPIAQIADVFIKTGPGMIRDENGRLAGYVFIDVAGRDIGGYVDEAKRMLAAIPLPSGYSLSFSGQYELMKRVGDRMLIVLPLTLFIIMLLIYFNTKSMVKTGIILLAVPFSLIGVAWILLILGYNMSIGVWCGIIALLGVDAETGIFMLLYLDIAYKEHTAAGRMRTENDLRAAIHEGAVKRVRPKMMTVLVLLVGLLPIMWAQQHEIGADVMKRIAAPMVGGIITSFLMELLVYPAVYFLWKRRELPPMPRVRLRRAKV